jgi:hypothetical protein
MQKSALSVACTSAGLFCLCDLGEATGEIDRAAVGDLASALGPIGAFLSLPDTNSAANLVLSTSFAPAALALSWSPCSPNSSCTSLIRLASACCCSFKLANSSAAEG